MNETICALATATGGAIGIIRISGPKTLEILSDIFTKSLTKALPNTIHYGHIKDKDEIIDEVLVSVFRAPHSYTGEESAEISCHGSQYILNKVLELLVKNGCRMANPGEFTMRAYLNGKMDLSQAEAVADIIASTNKATHQLAMSQLRGSVSNELSLLREQLLHLTSLMELELDFSDHEDLEFADRTELLQLTKKIDSHITRLAHSFETGQAIKQGIPVAIVGKTNVGKSTLLNRLLKDDRAIVSNVHGTTRDTIEDTIDIQGVTFRFIDTAGIRKTTDEVECIGIQRTYEAIKKARIVLWVIDDVPSPKDIQEIVEETNDKHLVIIQNKEDKAGASFDPEEAQIEVRGAALPYVSRGGLKLEKALKVFPIDLTDRVCMDIGASTGGFTDCMLQNGAARVYSIDVGYGQLDWKLRSDPRVVCMEKTNFRYVKPEDLGDGPAPSFASVDVSFIGLDKILPAAMQILTPGAEMVCLIKPQFEAGRDKVGKKGVVRDRKVHEEVVRDVTAMAAGLGFEVLGLDYSPIRGPEGNIEYLMHLKKPEEGAEKTGSIVTEEQIKELVGASHSRLDTN